MIPKVTQPWLSSARVEELVQLEPALLIFGLALGAWICSKFFLPRLTIERRRNLKSLFNNLSYNLALGILFFIIYSGLYNLPHQSLAIDRIITYVGFGTILVGAVVFVKVCRILVFQYFFLSHMRVAFPVLLVNLFTLLLSLILAAWIGAELFNIRLTPILATSAIFSLVLGLALQDTLGNLFAGVALQFDKPYEIGDWIEVHTGSQKWVGQVFEISWRATVLTSFTKEIITVPNRLISQAEISNFSTKFHPIIRFVIFRLPFSVNISEVKKILTEVCLNISQVRIKPSPKVLISETTESWIGFKLIFNIDDFGDQFPIIDRVYSEGIEALKRNGFQLASHRVTLSHDGKS